MKQKYVIVLKGRGGSGKTPTLLKVFDRLCGRQEKTIKDVREFCNYRGHEVFFTTMGDNEGIVQQNIECLEESTTWDIAVVVSRTRGETVKLLEDRFGEIIIPVWKKYGDSEPEKKAANHEDAEKILKMIDDIIEGKDPKE